jgi:hypothetical protein
MLGRRDHGVRPSRVPARERRIVAPDFSGCVLRVPEKEQVVDGDYLRRPARGDQEWMGGMHDVELAGEGFNRRPAGAVPQEIERPHRDPSIDSRHAKFRDDGGRQAVLPGAGEEGHLAGMRRGVRADQSVKIFADPRALAQGGAVVGEDAHPTAMIAGG